jgi:hypothetical protein
MPSRHYMPRWSEAGSRGARVSTDLGSVYPSQSRQINFDAARRKSYQLFRRVQGFAAAQS